MEETNDTCKRARTACSSSPNGAAAASWPSEANIVTFKADVPIGSTYVRTRHNNLRCFPTCAPVHKQNAFCGSPIYVDMKRTPSNLSGRVYGGFHNAAQEITWRRNQPFNVDQVSTEIGCTLLQARMYKELPESAYFIFMPDGKWTYAATLVETDEHYFTIFLVNCEDGTLVDFKHSEPFHVIPTWKVTGTLPVVKRKISVTVPAPIISSKMPADAEDTDQDSPMTEETRSLSDREEQPFWPSPQLPVRGLLPSIPTSSYMLGSSVSSNANSSMSSQIPTASQYLFGGASSNRRPSNQQPSNAILNQQRTQGAAAKGGYNIATTGDSSSASSRYPISRPSLVMVDPRYHPPTSPPMGQSVLSEGSVSRHSSLPRRPSSSNSLNEHHHHQQQQSQQQGGGHSLPPPSPVHMYVNGPVQQQHQPNTARNPTSVQGNMLPPRLLTRQSSFPKQHSQPFLPSPTTTSSMAFTTGSPQQQPHMYIPNTNPYHQQSHSNSFSMLPNTALSQLPVHSPTSYSNIFMPFGAYPSVAASMNNSNHQQQLPILLPQQSPRMYPHTYPPYHHPYQ